MAAALKSWELENSVNLVDPSRDALYGYNKDEAKVIDEARPWRKDPHHFKHVRISAVALLKMVMHARSGGSIEVMGMMLGYVQSETFIVTDAFRLPVEGTETRVNAHEEAYEYMVNFPDLSRQVGQEENIVGWYHSHPGYGCWLSGIDVATQFNNQTHQDPFLAIVIDPDRTVSAGKVEIGAFRTYPENYKPESGAMNDGFQTIPQGKVEDFGAHSSRYYSLEISHFKSTLDTKLLEALWNKYWVQTLSQSPSFTSREYGTKQIQDLSYKVKDAGQGILMQTRGGRPSKTLERDPQLDKVVRVSNNLTAEETSGLMAGLIKEKVFGTSEATGAGSVAREAQA